MGRWRKNENPCTDNIVGSNASFELWRDMEWRWLAKHFEQYPILRRGSARLFHQVEEDLATFSTDGPQTSEMSRRRYATRWRIFVWLHLWRFDAQWVHRVWSKTAKKAAIKRANDVDLQTRTRGGEVTSSSSGR